MAVYVLGCRLYNKRKRGPGPSRMQAEENQSQALLQSGSDSERRVVQEHSEALISFWRNSSRVTESQSRSEADPSIIHSMRLNLFGVEGMDTLHNIIEITKAGHHAFESGGIMASEMFRHPELEDKLSQLTVVGVVHMSELLWNGEAPDDVVREALQRSNFPGLGLGSDIHATHG